MERVIWLSFLRDCMIQNTPKSLPYQPVECLPDTELRKAVVTAVRDDGARIRPGNLKPSKVLTVDFGGDCDMSQQKGVQLLPGGKELFVIKQGRLELWLIEGNELLWRTDNSSVVGAYHFEATREDEVLVAVSSSPPEGTNSS